MNAQKIIALVTITFVMLSGAIVNALATPAARANPALDLPHTSNVLAEGTRGN